MSEPFIEKYVILTDSELSNANEDKHKRKSHCVCRRDHKTEAEYTNTKFEKFMNKSRKVYRKVRDAVYTTAI